MARARTHFVCRACGGAQPRWMGKCPECGAWDALERFVEPSSAAAAAPHAALASAWREPQEGPAPSSGGGDPRELDIPRVRASGGAVPLTEVTCADVDRLPTGIGELDRVLGGGLVPGSVVLLGGDPGIGKSTLLLQAAARLAASGRRVLYVSSEESAHQTRLRAERVFDGDLAALADLYVLAETNLGRIVEQTRAVRPAAIVLDSIQMVFLAGVESSPGSVAQLRRCCTELVYLAKVSGIAVVLVGHVTKDGQLAGPKLVEHLVDAVLSFEGDRHHAHRVVRGVKNRFGTTLEVGLFEMTGRGLREVDSGSVGRGRAGPLPPGAALCPAVHGTRCLLVEVQALTAPGFPGSAKRKVSGLDPSRLAMLIAVLEQHAGLRLADRDVFASAVGGLRVVEPAADLALCLAIAGAHRRLALPPGTAVIGEVGLGGEIRPAGQVEARLREAVRCGCRSFVVPAGQAGGSAAFEPAFQAETVAAAIEVLGPVAST